MRIVRTPVVSPVALSEPEGQPRPAQVSEGVALSGVPRDLSRVADDKQQAVARQQFIANQIAFRQTTAVRTVEHAPAAGAIQYGFESEFAFAESGRLLGFYAPTNGVDWSAWTPEQRTDWIKSLLPVPMSEEFPLPLEKAANAPAFLPPSLIVDSTGNVEVVSAPCDSLEALWEQVEALATHCGVGSLQAMISAPRVPLFGENAERQTHLEGFLNFHHLSDTFERLAVGYELYRADPQREPIRPFTHPWLGPMTKGKQSFMRDYLDENAHGGRYDEKFKTLVRRAFSSFKYIGGSAYRPDVAGSTRIAIEIRDTHKNKDLLLARLQRNTLRLQASMEMFAPFAKVEHFDSDSDYEKLPQGVRTMLEKVIPSQEKPAIAWMYSDFDKLALQVYRNFALPMKDYDDLHAALGSTVKKQIADARADYVSALGSIAFDHTHSTIDDATARIRVQGALGRFAVDSGIAERLTSWEQKHLVTDKHEAAYVDLTLKGAVPLKDAFPPTVWQGTLAQRLDVFTRRWSKHVTRDGDVFTIKNATPQLIEDYKNAIARGTASRIGDQLRLGHRTFDATGSVPFEPADEKVVVLGPLAELKLRKALQSKRAFTPNMLEGSPFLTVRWR